MLRAYKYRIYPTEEQKVMLAKTFGCCRYIYNWALDLKYKIYHEEHINISRKDLKKLVVHELKPKEDWLKEVSAKALEYAIEDLFFGYDMFFKGISKHPTYRKKTKRQHFHDGNNNRETVILVDYKHGLLTIPKIPNIPCVFHRRFKGHIKQVCVELLPSGKYQAKLLVDDRIPLPAKAPIDPNKALGIDVGMKHFAVLSDGQVYEPTHEGKKMRRRVTIISRQLSRKKIGSRQFKVYKRRLAKLHERITNRRHDRIQKITHYLAYESQATTICVEHLNLQAIRKFPRLGFTVEDACLGEFYRELEYKCAWAGKNYIRIDRFAPSSRMCSCCGYIHQKWSLNISEWTCPVCGAHHDRDLNAAINIKNIGLGLIETLPPGRGKVTPVERPTADDRSSEPKEQCFDSGQNPDKTGKMRSSIAPMPSALA